MNTITQRVVASHGLAAVAMSLPWPLLLVLVWEQTGDGWLLGVAGAARMLPYVALSWAAGRLADRFARDRIVRWTLELRIVLLAVVGVALAADRVWWALAAATLAIAVATPAYPALAAAMPDLARRETARATSWLVTCEVASFVVGPAIGGLLLGSRVQHWLPWVAVALACSAWLTFADVRLAAPARKVVGPGPDHDGMLAALRASAVMRCAILAVVVTNLIGSVLALALLPLAADGWVAGERAFGIATAAFGFGALAGPLAGRCGRPWRWGVRAWLVVLAVCLVAVAPTPSLAVAVAPLALAGAVAVQVETEATRLVQVGAPDELRASVLGVADSAMVAAGLVGALVAPILAGLLGPRVLVALAAGCCLLAVPLLRSAARGSELATVPSPEAVAAAPAGAVRR